MSLVVLGLKLMSFARSPCLLLLLFPGSLHSFCRLTGVGRCRRSRGVTSPSSEPTPVFTIDMARVTRTVACSKSIFPKRYKMCMLLPFSLGSRHAVVYSKLTAPSSPLSPPPSLPPSLPPSRSPALPSFSLPLSFCPSLVSLPVPRLSLSPSVSQECRACTEHGHSFFTYNQAGIIPTQIATIANYVVLACVFLSASGLVVARAKEAAINLLPFGIYVSSMRRSPRLFATVYLQPAVRVCKRGCTKKRIKRRT